MRSSVTLFIFMIFTSLLSAQVEKFTVADNTYYGTKAIPEEITGKYWYEKSK